MGEVMQELAVGIDAGIALRDVHPHLVNTRIEVRALSALKLECPRCHVLDTVIINLGSEKEDTGVELSIILLRVNLLFLILESPHS